ncbi:BON domain-containing protein [Rhodococcus antarcticus]|jgi:osmotically-inducible protein OsmY|uniref:BON domain-containing protein n=1 Tax=Rhodococcus antarcticus TaxID=2987751 RepID=A0ABY6P4M2_9NOCA|nr:BON domain-containing protein [Rhodococcus antarcticus]UZJ26449.1 BON domain-containing protein [Rhodococcus antarcticus]
MTQTASDRVPVSDAELKSAVLAELSWIPSVSSTHIGVAVADGAVTLSGEVDSFPEKLLAGKAVARVRGVQAIAQEITVRSRWGAANDTDIAREAGEAVHRAVDVPDTVHVAVRSHVVTLSGTVAWQHEREAAGRAVRYVRGVSGVLNTITLRPTATATGIKAAIGAALVRSAQLEGKHITVTEDADGVVTLEGTVRSWAERRAAEHASWSAPGVTGVLDHLRIEY